MPMLFSVKIFSLLQWAKDCARNKKLCLNMGDMSTIDK